MKNQYFLKDKKAQIYKEVKGESGKGGFYDSGYVPLGMLAPMIKCKKTPGKKCRFMAEGKKKR